jgi:threonylcarbamoyladenosine tRNA methylthiotransferase MtaB
VRVYIDTLGCRLNEAEADLWRRQFAGRGHELVRDSVSAEVMVLNTCAVTNEAARKSRKAVGNLHRRNPEAKLVVTGCYSELDGERAKEQTGVDLVVGNANKERLVELVSEKLSLPTMPSMATEPSTHHAFGETRTRSFIKVQDGCRNRCTFCIVTIARGDERSRSIDDLVREIRLLVNRGYQEAVLTGVHLGGYGSDLGVTLKELVETILEKTDIRRLRLSSLEPWDLPEDFWTLWENPRLMPHLHLPLQSGADGVLKRMARRCPTDEYRSLVTRFREAVPELVLTTDIIVGFPGETEDEFEQSLAFVEEIGFAHVHIFSFSPRQGTTAARLTGQVPGPVKRERSKKMHDLARTMRDGHHQLYHERVRPVLWEGEGERLVGDVRRYEGYTDNYLRVCTEVAADAPGLENRVTPVRLQYKAGSPILFGEADLSTLGTRPA